MALTLASILVLAGILGFLFAHFFIHPRWTVGFLLSALLPVLAAASYAISLSPETSVILGELGRWYWVWVAGAFLLGSALGLSMRYQEPY